MFDVIENNFVDEDVKLRLICAELTLFSVENEARQLRRHILNLKQRKYSFLTQLINVLHTDEEVGVKNIVTDVLRTLLEGEPQESASPERDLMTVFYQDFFKVLMEPLMKPIPASGTHSEADGVLRNNLLDLLGFFVLHHGYRIKYEILKMGFLQKTLELLKCRDKHLVLASLRFFRSLVGTSDKFYCKHIVKENLFEPVIQVFLQYEGRYNLINSAVLELFAFLRKENIKVLVAYFAQSFYERVKHIRYTNIFEDLKAKFEQNESIGGEASSTHSGVATPTRTPRSGVGNRIISEDQERFTRYASEENYFESEDDDDEDLPSPVGLGSGLSGGLSGVVSAGVEAGRTPGLSSIFPSLDHEDDLFRLAGNVSTTTMLPHTQVHRHVPDEMTEFGPPGGGSTTLPHENAPTGEVPPLVPYGTSETDERTSHAPVAAAAAAVATSPVATMHADDILNGSFEDVDLQGAIPQGSRKKRKSMDIEVNSNNNESTEPPSPKRPKETETDGPSHHVTAESPLAAAAEQKTAEAK